MCSRSLEAVASHSRKEPFVAIHRFHALLKGETSKRMFEEENPKVPSGHSEDSDNDRPPPLHP